MPSKNLSNLKVALVYDRVNKFGGAERVLLALHDLFPNAPLYTLVYDRQKAKWADTFTVIPTFLNKITLLRSRHELLGLLAPLAFESLDFSGFDLVISITSEAAKSIITKPPTLHVCYCLTPTRYLWSGREQYTKNPGMGIFSPLVKTILLLSNEILQKKDYYLSHRPDSYISISREVKQRLRRFYHQDSIVIYPPIDYTFWSNIPKAHAPTHFLVVSRLVPYKKVDLVVKAFSHPSLSSYQLVVVGDGSQLKSLKRLATPNITFRGLVDDLTLRRLYATAHVLIFPQSEDLGLTPLEAQACGTPVIAFGQGGAKETIVPGQTGLFFTSQTSDAIITAIKSFLRRRPFSPSLCRRQALRFSTSRFQALLSAKLDSLWQSHQKTLTS